MVFGITLASSARGHQYYFHHIQELVKTLKFQYWELKTALLQVTCNLKNTLNALALHALEFRRTNVRFYSHARLFIPNFNSNTIHGLLLLCPSHIFEWTLFSNLSPLVILWWIEKKPLRHEQTWSQAISNISNRVMPCMM